VQDPDLTERIVPATHAPPATTAIVVGVPSCNHAGTVASVVRAAQEGLGEFFGGKSSLLVSADVRSSDGTREQVRTLCAENPLLRELGPADGAGGAASPGVEVRELRMILEQAHAVHARACLVLDASVTSMGADWIERLVRPILDEQFDIVAPCPARHKLDGAISNGIVYPLTRALYGKRVRQPLGSVFALSGRLVERFLARRVWDIEVSALSTDARALSEAICGEFAVCQAFLGPAEHAAGGSSLDLSSILATVLGSVFDEMNHNVSFWQKVRGSEPVRWFGTPVEIAGNPPPVDSHKMWESFRLGCRTLQDVWSMVLPPATLLALTYLAREDGAALADDLWARIVYDFALGYRLHVMNRGHLLRALTPLYLGWLAGFVREMAAAPSQDVERRVQQLSMVYEAQKPYLISRWRWPDRFNP
jgi:glucosylglycerate synthase